MATTVKPTRRRRAGRKRTPRPRTVRFLHETPPRDIRLHEGDPDYESAHLYAYTRLPSGRRVQLRLAVARDLSVPADPSYVTLDFFDAECHSPKRSEPLAFTANSALRVEHPGDLDAFVALLRALVKRARRTHLMPVAEAA